MLVRHLFHRASTLLTDTDPQFARFTEREMVDAANDGQTAIASFLPQAATRIDSVKLRAGSLQRIDRIAAVDVLPGDGVAVTSELHGMNLHDALCNMGTSGTAPGKAVRLVSRDASASFNPGLMDAPPSNVVESYSVDPRMPTVFHVYPPSKGLSYLRIQYQAEPVRIPYAVTPGDYALGGGSAAAISLPDWCAEPLANYITARCAMKDAEHGLAPLVQMYTQLFTAFLNAQVLALTGNNPNLTVLPLAPAPAAQAAA